jgi:hypothetical protein
MKKCPKCGNMNDDNWPITVDGEIKEGGCQMCWETESDEEWWKTVCAMEIIK